MYIAQEMLATFNADQDLLKKIITGDESWVSKGRSNLLSVFFNCNGVVHHEFLPQGSMVNKKYYIEVMCRLRETFRHKRT